jgi:hypothetical protein
MASTALRVACGDMGTFGAWCGLCWSPGGGATRVLALAAHAAHRGRAIVVVAGGAPVYHLADDYHVGLPGAVLILDGVEQVGHFAAPDLLKGTILPKRIYEIVEDALEVIL